METLDSIMIRHEADKASKHPVGAHDYARFYDRAFERIRLDPLKMLEIGVGSGPSIQAWLEYFPLAKIYGVDTTHDTNSWNRVTFKLNDRYQFVCGDQSCKTFWACFLTDYGKDWDIIIDDGGHFNDQVITSFQCLWPALKSGGLYCIEDLGVSYGEASIFVKSGWCNHMTVLKELIDEMNRGQFLEGGIDSMHFSRELCILRKA